MGPGATLEAGGRHDILSGMRSHGIPLTAENYAVWQEYHTNGDGRLRRAIDILLSNGRAPDDRALQRLYAEHCAPVQESEALRDTAHRALNTLQHVNALLATAAPQSVSPTLSALMSELAGHTDRMVRTSESLVRRLTLSSARIEELEQFLTEARREAATDTLTGLANRRAFDTALRQAAGEAMNTETSLSVLIADVDHFKNVNDRWGHDVGDQVLRLVAATMKRVVRGRDLVARYGGEEFAVILPDTSAHGATAVAENLRHAICQTYLPVGPGNTFLTVTISIGASTYDDGEKLIETINRADRGLYQAKQEGRDRIAFVSKAS